MEEMIANLGHWKEKRNGNGSVTLSYLANARFDTLDDILAELPWNADSLYHVTEIDSFMGYEDAFIFIELTEVSGDEEATGWDTIRELFEEKRKQVVEEYYNLLDNMKDTYEITVTDSATYVIRAESREMAEELAVDWFHEREPIVKIKINNNEIPEIEI